jgi:hypothetical protein
VLALPLWLQTVHDISSHAPGAYARQYLAELRGGRLPARARFLDMAVPEGLVPAPLRPWNLASTVYPIARRDVRMTHDPAGALWIRPDGRVSPVRLEDVTTPVRPGCISHKAGAIHVTDVGLSEAQPPVLLALHYTSARAQLIALRIGPAGDPASASPDAPVAIDGSGELALPVAASPGEAVYLSVTGVHRVCLDNVRIVRPY